MLNRREFVGSLAALAIASKSGFAAPGPAPQWQIGCYTRPWAAFDFRAGLDAIAEAGYKYNGLMSSNTKSRLVIALDTTVEDAAKIGHEVRSRGLQIPSSYAGGFPYQKSIAEGVKGLRHLIDCCAAAGSKTILLGGTGDEKRYADYYKVIAECCDYGAEKNVGLTIKPHGGLNATGPECRKAVQMVGKKNFTLWYDAGNISFYSNGAIDPVEDAAAVDGLVTGWCIKDWSPKRLVPPAKTARPSKYTGDVALTPGTGKVDFKAVLARLKRGGFRGGPLVVECLTPGEPPHLLAEAKRAREFLTALVAG